MALIRKKKDAEQFLERFGTTARWDEFGGKHYFIFADRERGGIWTLMRYADGRFTIHGKGGHYCDEGETALTAEQSADFVWKHRSAINRAVEEPAA